MRLALTSVYDRQGLWARPTGNEHLLAMTGSDCWLAMGV